MEDYGHFLHPITNELGRLKKIAETNASQNVALKRDNETKDAKIARLTASLLAEEKRSVKYKEKAIKLQADLDLVKFDLNKMRCVQDKYDQVSETITNYKAHFKGIQAQLECALSSGDIKNESGSSKLSLESRTYECFSCKAFFLNEFHLSHHMKCSVCDTPQNEKHSCKICRKDFATSAELVAHSHTHKPKRKSADEQTLTCDICQKEFVLKSSYRQHMRSHENSSRYTCTECNKGFFQIADYTRHMRTHTGDRPYPCTHTGCDKKFTQQAHLVKHLVTHIKKISPKKISPKKFTEQTSTQKK